jgi:1-acyl-sn-glycerol-3-phosphate acyltransferase
MEKNQKPWSEHNFRLYNTGFKIAKFALGKKFDYHFHGLENIEESPGIFTMNHQRFEDSVFLAMAYTEATGLPMAMISQAEYAQGLGVRGKDGKRRFGRIVRFFVNNVGAISIDRSGDMTSLRTTIDEVESAMEAGVSVGVHTDATRAENSVINKYHPLFTRIGMDLGVPLYSAGGLYTPAKEGEKEHFDLTMSRPFTPDYYNSLHLKLLPKNMRVEHVTNELEKFAAQATGLHRTHKFAEIPKTHTQG